MKKISVLLFLFASCILSAQVVNEIPDSTVFTFAEEMPEFQGGGSAFMKYLASNVKYPNEEKENNHQGTVYIGFVVEKNGAITNVTVVKEVADAPGLSAEGIRVISQMPNWTPGRNNGKAVRVKIVQPIRFVLVGDEPEKKHRRKKKNR